MIAKIEKPEAIEQLDAIVAAADALMVARGDLGVEIGAADVPMLQKRLIRIGREAGKPVITATQMLESMIEPRADARRGLRRRERRARRHLGDHAQRRDRRRQLPGRGGRDAGAHRAAVEPSSTTATRPSRPRAGPALHLRRRRPAGLRHGRVIAAAAIVVPTVTGESAREVSKHRPRRTIVACTPSCACSSS